MAVRGFLIDIDGVLVSGGKPINGAAHVLNTLLENGYHFRCLSNTTQRSRETIATQMKEWNFPLDASLLFTPPCAAVAHILRSGKRRCYLISTGHIDREFETAGIELIHEPADFVVIGDAGEQFTFPVLNQAFRLVLEGAELLALERDRYWMSSQGLMLAAGPFVAAIEYATGVTAQIMGKPSPRFFAMALEDMGLVAGETAMIGDDILTDIGGAQQCGMQGILVRTGKYRPDTLKTTQVRPDKVIDSIANIEEFL